MIRPLEEEITFQRSGWTPEKYRNFCNTADRAALDVVHIIRVNGNSAFPLPPRDKRDVEYKRLFEETL